MNRESRTTLFGASEYEIEMVGRLNSLISSPNSGHSGTFRGGNGGGIMGHATGWMPAMQQFKSPALLQSLGSIRGVRYNPSMGLPNSQPPSGIPTPLLDLLLQNPS